MGRDDAPARLRVSVVYRPRAGEIDVVELWVDAGTTVADALHASGLQARHPGVALAELQTGIWGTLCRHGDVLRDRDRVELYRPLRVDPKEARRLRYRAQAKAKAKR